MPMMFMRGRRRRALTAALCVALVGWTPAYAAARPVDTGHSPSAVADDDVVVGDGDTTGYHLYTAAAANGWKWRALASIQPGGYEDERWIGQQCLTGDGRTVVAVIAPWSANNSEAGMNAGAFAYTVNLATGAVRPVASGVSLAYFDPGCGSGSIAALTSYLATGQSRTRISVLDTATGRLSGGATVAAELTAATVAGGRVLAARGSDLVDVTAGRVSVVRHFAGQLSDLRAASDGGVDLLEQVSAGRSRIWHWTAIGAQQVGSGPTATLQLLPGARGRNQVAGASSLTRDSGLLSVDLPASATALAASSRGGLVVLSDTAAPADSVHSGDPDVSVWRPGSAASSRVPLPAASARRTLAVPSVSAAGTAQTAPRAAGPRVTQAAETSIPQCAVPRNDIFKQVWQPSADQVRWAVNQAALSALAPPNTGDARPPANQMYTVNDASYAALPTTYPSQQWPLTNLAPAGSGPAVTVPPLVMYGILAQESNWEQASWHALPGRAGNPLVADYYGVNSASNASGAIDYSYSDCGYGIAQVTSGMQNSAYPGATGSLDAASQDTLAVDYASNIAYAEMLLQIKWTQLQNLGIKLNNNDPTKVENWYAAIWGYNSGVYTAPNSANGLGWFNNPANPIYPSRHTFLHNGAVQTLGDAATPQRWPYQEKVFGWMEVPLEDNGVLDYRGTYDWDTNKGSFLNTPDAKYFCSTTVNNCDPLQIGANPCPADSSACWWNAPATWVTNCATACVTDTPSNAPNNHMYYDVPGLPEPASSPVGPDCSVGASTPVSGANGNLLAGTVLIDDEMIASQNPGHRTPNLMGCAGTNTQLAPSVQASFSLLASDGKPIDAAAGPGESGQIDLHQLGGGLGGHLFFTHTEPSTDTADQVKGVWSATLPADAGYGTVYQLMAFVPDIAAATAHAAYQVSMGGTPATYTSFGPPGTRHAPMVRTISQAAYTNQWINLGYYLCGGPDIQNGATTGPSSCSASVTLSNLTPSSDSTQGSDIAYDAVAFVPAPLGAYVAMGDSYSSGEGLQGGFADGTDVTENLAGDHGNLCHVSSGAWPGIYAPQSDVPLVDLACSGSNMWDEAGVLDYMNLKTITGALANIAVPADNGSVYYTPPPTGGTQSQFPPSAGNWQPNGHTTIAYHVTATGKPVDTWSDQGGGSDYYYEASYQAELVRALRPKFVSVTLGGNDLGFASIVQDCILIHGEWGDRGPCYPDYANTSGPDKIDTKLASLVGPWTAAFKTIAAAAGSPNKVIVMTYAAPISATTANLGADNFDCSGITLQDRQWLVPKVGTLDSDLVKAAQAAGIPAQNIANEVNAFAGHELCTGTPFVTEPGSTLSVSEQDNFFHPNTAGYNKLEQDFVAVLHGSKVPGE